MFENNIRLSDLCPLTESPFFNKGIIYDKFTYWKKDIKHVSSLKGSIKLEKCLDSDRLCRYYLHTEHNKSVDDDLCQKTLEPLNKLILIESNLPDCFGNKKKE